MATAKKKPATATAKKTTRKTTARKVTTRKTSGKKTSAEILNYQQRYQMIAEAAYHIAEKHDFMPDNELEHWLQAENQIDSWISSKNIQLSN